MFFFPSLFRSVSLSFSLPFSVSLHFPLPLCLSLSLSLSHTHSHTYKLSQLLLSNSLSSVPIQLFRACLSVLLASAQYLAKHPLPSHLSETNLSTARTVRTLSHLINLLSVASILQGKTIDVMIPVRHSTIQKLRMERFAEKEKNNLLSSDQIRR